MSASERMPSLTATAGGVDPLLKDLSEKKQSIRRNAVALASELKETRNRLLERESLIRQAGRPSVSDFVQEAETKAKMMEDEITRLQKNLQEKNVQLQASTSAAEMYAKELDDLKSQLAATKEIAEASAVSAQSAHLLCSSILKQVQENEFCMKEQESRVDKLEEQLEFLLNDLRAREFSQVQLKDEVLRIEHEIMQTLSFFGFNGDCEQPQRMSEEAPPRNFDRINKYLTIKDDEIGKLRDDIRIVSAHWMLKTKDMESQIEKHRKADQELKKKVMKLELYLQEARSQTRKLHRMGEQRDKALKAIRDQQLADEQATSVAAGGKKHNFWETSFFKIAVPVVLVLVLISKR
ncbi:hypothetical protein M569_08476 [Genlisea aurea]|uniref:Uncharacterized protein n=1 Tax=Genlisea aurea TaxID=192259 RepID=S8CNE6_9LAMI|nr:hypothetical protein M569_08476 [Genlisea aurea]